MSHFCVLVTGDDLDDQLAPFSEATAGREFLEFHDMEEDLLREYQADPRGCATFDEFAKAEHWSRDSETGRYGYWHNPRAKWDWWVVGGRWSGYFTLRPGAEGDLGEPGAFGNEAAPGTADSCLKRDVDVEAMMSAAEKDAAESFDVYARAIEGHPRGLSFRQCREKFPGDLEAAHTFYHAQPAMKALEETGVRLWLSCPFETFGTDRSAYLERRRNAALVPFAVLHEGKWSERGEMGWFGVCSNEKGPGTWAQEFQAFWKSLPSDTRVTIVDCHI